MFDPGRCRFWAQECIEIANATTDTKTQTLLFEMARTWVDVADRIEQGTALVAPPREGSSRGPDRDRATMPKKQSNEARRA
jgi:hypothetical protein